MALQFPQINWNMLTQMGDRVAELGPIMRERQLRNDMAGLIGPDGKISDWDKASALVTQNSPIAGLELAQRQQHNKAMEALAFAKASRTGALGAGDRKAQREATLNSARTKQAIDTLKQAYGLIGPKGDGIYDQYGAGLRADIGTKLPFGISDFLGEQGVVDREKAMRTQKYRAIMGPEAIKWLSNSLKGPTSEKEMKTFMDMYNDPSTPNDVKALQLEKLLKAAEADAAVYDAQMNEDVGAGGGAAPAGREPPQEAIEALNADPNLRDQFEEYYGVSADDYLLGD